MAPSKTAPTTQSAASGDPDARLLAQPFEVIRPAQWTAPVVFASPHSGDHYPKAFIEAARLDPVALRRSEDAFIDEVYAAAPELGAPLLKARFPRAYVDPNREPWELDAAMFEGQLPDYVNTASPRVKGGLGTVAKVVTNGEAIYKGALDFEEVRQRIEAYYVPYHAMMTKLIDEAVERFSTCILIDCHSMPSIGGPMDRDPGFRRVDMVLGDCHGTACAPAVIDLAQAALEAQGFKVTRNAPYAGGFTTHHWGRPSQGIHALQIEINRALYMDEVRIARGPGLAELIAKMRTVIAAIASVDPGPLKGELPSLTTAAPAPAIAVRDATADDMAAVQAIYAHHVEVGVSSFEEVAPDLDEMRRRYVALAEKGQPYLVATVDGVVRGYAYAGPFRPRSAYRYTLEDSIYVDVDATGLGLGRLLLGTLIDRATALGYRQMVAVIGGGHENARSVALHRKLGFAEVAHLPSAGFKFGRWVDTVIMQRALGAGNSDIPVALPSR